MRNKRLSVTTRDFTPFKHTSQDIKNPILAEKESLLFSSIRKSSVNLQPHENILPKHNRHNSMEILPHPVSAFPEPIDQHHKEPHKRSGSDLGYIIIPSKSPFPSSPTNYKLGPGYYNISLSTLSGPSFQFSTLSRFIEKESYLFLPALHKQIGEEGNKKEKFKEIVKDNKNMMKYMPENRIKTIKERAGVESVKIVETIQKKHEILLNKKLEKILNFESKQRRFEFKLKREEVSRIFRAWITMDAAFGWATDIHEKFLYRKDLHERSQGVLKKLMILCMSVGKFKRLVKKIRRARAIRSFKRMHTPAIKWATEMKKKYRQGICELAERALSRDVMFNLMAAFIRTVIFIQRTMKVVVKQRQQGLIIKHLLWNKVEYRMYIEHCVKKHTLPKSELDKRISFNAVQGHSSIPELVKAFFIKTNLKLRRDAYVGELKEYKKVCNGLRGEYEKTRYKREADAALNNTKIEELKLPPKPQPNYVFSEQDFRKMINETEQRRGEWDEIIKKQSENK